MTIVERIKELIHLIETGALNDDRDHDHVLFNRPDRAALVGVLRGALSTIESTTVRDVAVLTRAGATERATTIGAYSREGARADDPRPPAGDGWALDGVAAADGLLFFAWSRARSGP